MTQQRITDAGGREFAFAGICTLFPLVANVLTSLSVKCFEIENRLAFGEVTVRSMVAFFWLDTAFRAISSKYAVIHAPVNILIGMWKYKNVGISLPTYRTNT